MSSSHFAFVVIMAASYLSQTQPDNLPFQNQRGRDVKAYDGRWWVSADSEEQGGFLNGSADCLVWDAHEKWVSHSIVWAIPKINEYYQKHKANNIESVIDVWRKILAKAPPDADSPAAERWTNPHGYYDGLYWRQGSGLEHVGFLEGYIGCLNTQVPSALPAYSKSVDYYVDKIKEYVNDTKAHPHSDHEAIANILAHFRDSRTKPNANSH